MDVYHGACYRSTSSGAGDLLGKDIPISIEKSDQNGRVSVAASDLAGFLVTFVDDRTTKFKGDVYAQRVDTSGKLQGGNFPVSNAADTQQWSALA